MVLDYSKFDNIVDSDDEETAPKAAPAPHTYTEEERARLTANAEAAAAKAMSSSNDPRAEIERLKAERRAKSAAKAAAAPGDAAPVEPAAAQPEAQPEPEPEADDPLSQLDRAEKAAEAIATEASSILAALEGGDKIDAAKRAPGLAPMLGKLQNAMEEISIGSLDDDARVVAKARRMAINKRIEEELMPACAACRGAAAKANA